MSQSTAEPPRANRRGYSAFSPPSAAVSSSSPPAASLLVCAILADDRRLELQLKLLLGPQARRRQRRDHRLRRGRRAASHRPGPGSTRAAACRRSTISETSWAIDSGIEVGSASTSTSCVTCSSTPPSRTPGADSVPTSSIAHDSVDRHVEADAYQVEVNGLAADRMALLFLQHRRRRRAAVDRDLEHGAARREREAQLARVDRKGDRLAVAAVENAGNEARRGAAGA